MGGKTGPGPSGSDGPDMGNYSTPSEGSEPSDSMMKEVGISGDVADGQPHDHSWTGPVEGPTSEGWSGDVAPNQLG